MFEKTAVLGSPPKGLYRDGLKILLYLVSAPNAALYEHTSIQDAGVILFSAFLQSVSVFFKTPVSAYHCDTLNSFDRGDNTVYTGLCVGMSVGISLKVKRRAQCLIIVFHPHFPVPISASLL